jgi:hypothetical protein
MINISTSQKQVVLDFFEEDIKIVKKYFSAVAFGFDDDFKYDIFKEFIFSAAGMIKSIDMGVYNSELVGKFSSIKTLDKSYSEFKQKSEFALRVYNSAFLTSQNEYQSEKKAYETKKNALQMLISKEAKLNEKYNKALTLLEEKKPSLTKKAIEDYLEKLKPIRREHVDTIHLIGTEKQELDEMYKTLTDFEEQHKASFMEFFQATKEKLEYQYIESLNYFGFAFNEALFINSEKSRLIQKFKSEARIDGDINLCKYLEYYLRSVSAEALADVAHKNKLAAAKEYCKNHQKNLF